MNPLSTKSGSGWVKVAVAIIVAAGLGWLAWQSQQSDSLEVTTREVSPSELPGMFPEGFPLESGATVVQNYTATTPDGRQQATRAFVSNRSLERNMQTYGDYLSVDHWVVQATKDEADYKAIMAEKEGVTVQVVMTEVSGTKTVQVTFTTAQPAATSTTP
jgi:hypothetical protein